MAIDARLIQAGIQQGIEANQPVTNLLSGINAGQNFMQNRQNLQRGNIQNQVLQDQAPLQQQQLEQGVAMGDLKLQQEQAIVDLLGVPDMTTAKEVAFNFAKISSLSDEQIPAALQSIKDNAIKNNRQTPNIDEVMTVFARDQVAGKELINNVINAFERTGVLETQGGSLTASEQEFNSITSGFSEEDKVRARRIEAGLDPRAIGSAVQTITDKGNAESIGDTESTIAGRKEFGKLTGASRAKKIDVGFEQIGNIDKNIRNINRAITAIDEGASTGAIESRFFPTLTKATAQLEQVQRELGLDIVSSVTFGALSEGELDLALQTALPTKLEPEALKEFLINKKESQSKLRSYYQEQIEFLDNGGTVAGFLRSINNNQQGNTTTSTGRIKFDSQGNIIQ